MTSIGKKILSAFVEVTEHDNPVPPSEEPPSAGTPAHSPSAADTRFREHFEKLLQEANTPGPDYFEFAKMIDALGAVPDEKARYAAAFAGLNVQGLNRQQLLSSADAYLQLLQGDAATFQATLDTAQQEKVFQKKAEIEAKGRRIEQLSQEITVLHQQLAALNNEIRESEEKLAASSAAYTAELHRIQSRIEQDLQKIRQHIAGE
ncbi:hypothetical protein V9K67_14855 [Paraflavisolibacter sp. H34]|uniref:hypothetical protein n=1 Tax=Huijunlia imazamoxiresistens TaxID=3127457 RepID=UPI003018939B